MNATEAERRTDTAAAWAVATFPTITPETSVAAALRLVREHGLPALPVLEAGRLVGFVRAEDLLRLTPSEATLLDVHEQRALLDQVSVRRVVSAVPASTAPTASILSVARAMAATGAAVVPVVDDTGLVGLLPWTAVLAAASHARKEDACHDDVV